MKESIEVYWPSRFDSLKPLINTSLIIGAPKKSLHCFYTLVYLIISLAEIIICLTLMTYAVTYLWISIQTDKSESSRNFKKRLITICTIRTVLPMLTFNLPAFFGVYIVQFDRDDTSAFVVQWCLMLILFSPAVCCFTTVIGVKPYRQGLYRVLRLKISRGESIF